MSLFDDVADLRARGLSPTQIAKQLGAPKAKVKVIIREIAIRAAQEAPDEEPVHTCVVTPGWSLGLGIEHAARDWLRYDDLDDPTGGGMAVLLVARRSSSTRLRVATYLVDTWQRGLVDGTSPDLFPERDLEAIKGHAFKMFGGRCLHVPIELARALVLGGAEHAEALGRYVDVDLEEAKRFLGDVGADDPAVVFGAEVPLSRGEDEVALDLHDWNDEEADPELAGSMVGLHTLCPELAEAETRSLTVLHDGGALPPDTYGFLELYCPDPKCDCRRAMFSVVAHSTEQVVATINYGFDGADPRLGTPQTFLDPLGRQSELAEGVLELFEGLLLEDPAYVERLYRHYDAFKRRVAELGGGRDALVTARASSPSKAARGR